MDPAEAHAVAAEAKEIVAGIDRAGRYRALRAKPDIGQGRDIAGVDCGSGKDRDVVSGALTGRLVDDSRRHVEHGNRCTGLDRDTIASRHVAAVDITAGVEVDTLSGDRVADGNVSDRKQIDITDRIEIGKEDRASAVAIDRSGMDRAAVDVGSGNQRHCAIS